MEVGANLYELDTEAEATVTVPETPKSATTETTESSTSSEPIVVLPTSDVGDKAESSHRTPSIKFLGKEGWARILSGAGQSAPVLYTIPADYGRPEFSDDEIEALVMGGANLVPDVIHFSSGAEFGHS